MTMAVIPSARADVPPLPRISPVPSSGQAPLSSATRPGTEYSDLAKAGYTEEEYYLSGEAPAITAQGQHILDAPFTTRILVRKPTNPDKFNGTVIIEPFSWFGERAAGWILARDYLLRKGYAYVGYTLNFNQPVQDPKFPPIGKGPLLPRQSLPNLYQDVVNLDFMRRYDYARYAPLGMYYDPARFTRGGQPDPFPPQAQGIAAQLALLLKSNLSDGPLSGLSVRRVYVNSWAVTAQVWFDYLDQGRHQQWTMPNGQPLIDAYMGGRTRGGSVAGEVIRLPRKLPDNTPFVFIYSQTEALRDAKAGIPLPPDTDHPRLRYYEVAGMSHLRLADHGTLHKEYLASDVGKGGDPRCQHIYDEPVEVVASALLDGMDKWVRDGKSMPKGLRLVRSGQNIARDTVTNNMIGGVRPPWITVPAAAYMNDAETGCGLIYDTKIPYSPQQLRAMYGSFENYRRRFETAKAAAVHQGIILKEDMNRVQPVAQPKDFVVPGHADVDEEGKNGI